MAKKTDAEIVSGIATVFTPLILLIFLYRAGESYWLEFLENGKYMLGFERLTGTYSPDNVYFPDELIIPFELPESALGTIIFLFCPCLVISVKTLGIKSTILRYFVFGFLAGVRFLIHLVINLVGLKLQTESSRLNSIIRVIVNILTFVVEVSNTIVAVFWQFTRPMMFYNYLGISILMVLYGDCFDRYVLFDFVAGFSIVSWCIATFLFSVAGIMILLVGVMKVGTVIQNPTNVFNMAGRNDVEDHGKKEKFDSQKWED